MSRDREIEKYKRALGIAIDALTVYADPESYHAVAFMADRPAGVFADDFGAQREHKHPHYRCAMPGKLARQAMRKIARRYGNLPYVGRELE